LPALFHALRKFLAITAKYFKEEYRKRKAAGITKKMRWHANKKPREKSMPTIRQELG